MLDDMAEEIKDMAVEMRDPDLIDQCYTFVQNQRGKAEADGNFLDDFIIAYAICGRVIKDFPFKAKKNRTAQQRAMMREKKVRKNAGMKYSKRSS